jgi:hypothetical protein
MNLNDRCVLRLIDGKCPSLKMKPDEAIAHIIGPCVNQIDALKSDIHELTREVNTLREALGMPDLLDMPEFRDYA